MINRDILEGIKYLKKALMPLSAAMSDAQNRDDEKLEDALDYAITEIETIISDLEDLEDSEDVE